MLNIVIPMAGRGTRFVKEGYTLPKPLIPVRGVPMIKVVTNNLRPACEHQFIFLCLEISFSLISGRALVSYFTKQIPPNI